MERFSIRLNRILPEVKTESVQFSTATVPENGAASVENFSENVEKTGMRCRNFAGIGCTLCAFFGI